ncbi:FTR1 family protein [Beijerinckia sp. L45]|uniref:FTR1 family iron permease n=1 Tax=Beijerinckia sp. L45 TaxID=1641855 RepID=UPI00131D240A|nr:FTR1 family protein [Beijerinckia sp. L45]
MIGALIIVFREVIEAGLIVGIVLAVTHGVPGRLPYVAGGIVAGLAGAGLVAIFAGALASLLEGSGQEVFNASILIVAALMLTWHNVWMAKHGREMAQDLKKVGAEVQSGTRSLFALAVVIGVAVLREGSEVVLFLYGVVVSSGATGWQILVGGALGLALGVGLSAITFAGLVRIPLKHLFRVTSVLIAFMAAGMAAQAVAFLEQADIATVMGRAVWNTSRVLPDNSILGRILHTLFGYTDRPSELQLLVYVAALLVIFGLMKALAPHERSTRPIPAE